jgi:SAM-dependent methyltransferase
LNGRFALHQLAAENIESLPTGHFHAVSAMEVFCYLSTPRDGMAEAARVLRPGGWLFASVESPIGSLEPHVQHSRDALDEALKLDRQAIEDDMWVRYFTPDTLREEIQSVGLEVEAIIGTHYLPDGPMHHLVDIERLGEPAYESALIELERLLQDSNQWKDAPRAWVVVAKKLD